MKTLLKTVAILLIIVLIPCFAVASGQKENKGDLGNEQIEEIKTAKLAYVAAIDSPVDIAFEKFAADVLEKTEGKLVIQLYPASMLGTETELKDMVSIGSVQMISSGWSLLMTSQPDSIAYFGYYQLLNVEELNAFYSSDIAKAMYDYHEQQTGARVVATNFAQGMRHTASKDSFTNLEELKGTKIRVPAGVPLDVKAWTKWGAMPTPLAFAEVYSSLQTGVIDACEVPLEFIYNYSLYEHAPHIMLTGHQMYNNLVEVNAEWFDGLSENMQQIVLECLKEAGEYESKLLEETQQHIIDDMKSKGVTFVEISEDVKMEMRDLVADLYKEQQQSALDHIGYNK